MVDARDYHDQTKHSPRSVRENSFRLDRSNQPRPYKVYEDLPHLSLPTDSDPPDVPALSAIAQSHSDPTAADGTASSGEGRSTLDATDLATLCRYATGVTKELEIQGRQMRFRAAACTGKLYHVDLYAVVGDLPDLDAGVYHYDPDGDAFDVLREGDFRGVLAAASADHPGVTDAPVTFVATSTWWRNAWKYRDRTYRHAFWDSGTILANLLGVAHGMGHRADIVTGFADGAVAELLGVDPAEEAPVELVPVGSGDPVPEAAPVDPIDPSEAPLSDDPVDYPLNHDAWEQSALPDAEAVTDWRDAVRDADELGVQAPGDGDLVQLNPVDADTQSARPIVETIQRRGSLREYSHDPISDRKFATVLDRALGGIPGDWTMGDTDDGTETRYADSDRAPGRLIDCYCLVHAVDSIDQGAYQYHPDKNVLERLGDTDRETAGRLALGQSVVGDAAVNVYLMADVDAIVETLGNRGYRVAQLEGGISLGRLYLATYAHLALGGRGFTFFDDLVSEHFSPRAANQTPMTLFAFGKPSE